MHSSVKMCVSKMHWLQPLEDGAYLIRQNWALTQSTRAYWPQYPPTEVDAGEACVWSARKLDRRGHGLSGFSMAIEEGADATYLNARFYSRLLWLPFSSSDC